MAKKKLKIFVTPPGIASYPFLNRPDTKYKDEGEYHLKLVVNGDDAQPLIKQIDEATEIVMSETKADLKEKKKNQALKKLEAHHPYEEELDDDGEPTGNIIFGVFKMKAHVKTKDDEFDQTPDLFDAKKKPLKEGTRIGSGTKAKVAFQMVPFYTPAANSAGISLRLKAVQVINLVEYGGGSADSYGFGDEDGYEMGDDDDEVTNSNEEVDASDEEDEDF